MRQLLSAILQEDFTTAPVIALFAALALLMALAPSAPRESGDAPRSSLADSAVSPSRQEGCGARGAGERPGSASAEAYAAADGDPAALARLLGCLRELHPARVS